MNEQEILLKDIIKDKTIQELINLLPFKVYVKDDKYIMLPWISYNVIGFGKDTVLLGYDVSYYDEDVGFGGGMTHVDAVTSLSIGNIPDNYIVAHEPTLKQKQFLEKFTKVDPNKVCGYQAHRIISKTIKRWEQEKEQNPKIDDIYTSEIKIGINGL